MTSIWPSFDYNLERVIDDFLLLTVFVSNNFLPDLPHFHIHANGLERLFDVNKKILPSLGQCMLCRQPHQTSLLTCHSRCRLVSQGEWDYQHSTLTDGVGWDEGVETGGVREGIHRYKGKQTKHEKEMEMGRKYSKPSEQYVACLYRQPS